MYTQDLHVKTHVFYHVGPEDQDKTSSTYTKRMRVYRYIFDKVQLG